MENKLTNEEVTRVFAMYWGCETSSGKVLGIKGNYSLFVGVNDYNIELWYKLSETKLLLTPLSAITDKDAIQLAKILESPVKYNSYTIERTINYTCVWMSHYNVKIYFDGRIRGTQAIIWHYNHAFPFLISKGYSAPLWFGIDHWANGKTAIELGIAIDKTKTTQP